MQIKTITCHDVYNLGASLQAYALQTYLQSLGHDVQIIDYKPDYLSQHYKLWSVPIKYNKPFIRLLYLIIKLPGRLYALKRKKVFDEFTCKYLKLTQRYHSNDELKVNPPLADIYIAGSDQIWNTKFRNGTDPSFYLDFGDNQVKRLSYAASFATSELRKGTEDFVNNKIKSFDSISVREPSGIDILHSMGYNATLVCDPVFLIDAETWSNKIASKDWEDERYILVYDFENSTEIKKNSERIAKVIDCKIFSVGPYKLKYADKNYINSGPEAFVALVKNAQCVISNSFHATAFSFIFKRDVFVVKRADGLNTRMQDLLNRYGIINRLIDNKVSNDILLSHIDYEKITPILSNEIEFSKQWLNKNILKDKN